METTTQLIKALSEETRLRIVLLLLNGELCVCDLMAVLNLPQSTVSRHLAYLKNANWVEGARRGVWMYYRLAENISPLQKGLLSTLSDNMKTMHGPLKDQQALTMFLAEKSEAHCS